jgi:hypothetical protein
LYICNPKTQVEGQRSFTKCELLTFKTIQADVAQLARAADL